MRQSVAGGRYELRKTGVNRDFKPCAFLPQRILRIVPEPDPRYNCQEESGPGVWVLVNVQNGGSYPMG